MAIITGISAARAKAGGVKKFTNNLSDASAWDSAEG
jgi:hypothetical protein